MKTQIRLIAITIGVLILAEPALTAGWSMKQAESTQISRPYSAAYNASAETGSRHNFRNLDDSSESDGYAGYDIDPSGWADTGDFLDWIYVEFRPWILNLRLDKWIYAPEESMTADGGWLYVPSSLPLGLTDPHWQTGMYNLDDHLPHRPNIINVANQGELASAVAAAEPGDRIQIAPGSYSGFTLRNRSGTATDRIIIEASDFDNPPVFQSTIKLDGSSFITLYRLFFDDIANDAVQAFNRSNELQIARCVFIECDPRVFVSDRFSAGFAFRNNRVDSHWQFDASGGLKNTQIARDSRPNDANVPEEDRPWRAKIWHNIFETTQMNWQIRDGKTQGHWIYDQTDRYCGCVDQQSSIKYNWVQTPRKHVPELKAGGWELIGNYISQAQNVTTKNTTVNIRQTSDEAPAGQGANVFRGNVYDGILEVNIRGTGGERTPHYINGDLLMNGARMRLFRNSDAGAHGDRAAHGMRLDFVGGGPLEVGFSWLASTGPVEGVELHDCSFNSVTLTSETGTEQDGLTELEPQYPTHILQKSEVGPEAFSQAKLIESPSL